MYLYKTKSLRESLCANLVNQDKNNKYILMFSFVYGCSINVFVLVSKAPNDIYCELFITVGYPYNKYLTIVDSSYFTYTNWKWLINFMSFFKLLFLFMIHSIMSWLMNCFFFSKINWKCCKRTFTMINLYRVHNIEC